MASSEMLRRVALVKTDFSEELSASFIRVTRIDELETALAVTSNRRTMLLRTDSCYRDGGAMFLRNVGSYKSHTASHPRRRHSSTSLPVLNPPFFVISLMVMLSLPLCPHCISRIQILTTNLPFSRLPVAQPLTKMSHFFPRSQLHNQFTILCSKWQFFVF
jgi:hypothetical protein